MAPPKGHIPWNKGKTGIYSLETRKRISIGNKGKISPMKGKHHTKETKKLLSDKFKIIAKQKGFGKWMKGRKNTPFLLGHKKVAEFRKGKTYKEIYGERAREEALKRKISNRNRWKNRKRSEVRLKHNADYRYNEWRKFVFERDNYICQKCKEKGRLEAHHILSWKNYPELRYELNNGITLCLAHHPRKRAEEKQLASFFMNLIETKAEF